MKKVCLPLTKEIHLIFDHRAVIWEEDDGTCLQRRKYVGTISGASIPFYTAAPSISCQQTNTGHVGFPGPACSAKNQYLFGMATSIGCLEKSICIFLLSLTVSSPIWNIENECLM